MLVGLVFALVFWAFAYLVGLLGVALGPEWR